MEVDPNDAYIIGGAIAALVIGGLVGLYLCAVDLAAKNSTDLDERYW